MMRSLGFDAVHRASAQCEKNNYKATDAYSKWHNFPAPSGLHLRHSRPCGVHDGVHLETEGVISGPSWPYLGIARVTFEASSFHIHTS